MSHATPPQIDDARAGFTIIEVLVALAVVAVGVVGIGSVMATNFRGVRSLEQHVALMETARSLMATAIPPRAELTPGVRSGTLDDYRWQIDVGPLDEGRDVSDENAVWSPALVKIHVRSPSGGAVDLETIRLMHRPRQ